MISLDTFFGGSRFENNVSDDVPLRPKGDRFFGIRPIVDNVGVVLPDATKLNTGGPYFFILNAASDRELLIKNHLGSTIGSIAELKLRFVYLIRSGTPQGSWGISGENSVGVGGEIGDYVTDYGTASNQTGTNLDYGDANGSEPDVPTFDFGGAS